MINDEERQELIEEIRLLKAILDFHVKNQDQTLLNKADFEAHVNDILDRINVIKKQLKSRKDE